MSILKFFHRSKTQSFYPRDPALAKWFGIGRMSDAGISVDEEAALRSSTAYACVKVLSEDVAKLPLLLYREGGDFDEEEKKHPLSRLLKKRPNSWQTPFELKKMMAHHAILRGAGYARIVPDGKGGIAELHPLHPDRVTPFRAPDGGRAFAYQPLNGARQILLQDEVWYVPGMTIDGYTPVSVIEYARETLGLALATQKYGARFFSNDATPGLYLKHPAKMSQDAYDRLKKSWEDRHKGADNAHKPAILEEGLDLGKLSMTAQDAQFVESRKLSPIEICQFFRMQPHKVQILDRATFSNIEHQALEYVGDTLMPWLVGFEQSADRDLLKTNSDRETLYFKFDVEELMRGDLKSRFDAYSVGINAGFMNRNEPRRKEKMKPFAGGDEFLRPLNMDTTKKTEPQK